MSAMDGVYSIASGLLLRVVVDAATFHNVKLAGTLIGLWEGVVVLHYVNKAPTSSDPYLALGVRLFADFIVTESIFRLMIVLLWTTLGTVLADIAPAVWEGYGLRKRWSKLRRELYWTMRTVSFSRKRTPTVRFVTAPTIASASDVSSLVGSTVVTAPLPPSTFATESVSPHSPIISHPPIRGRPGNRRRSSVPGTFLGADWSETETEAGSRVGVDQASTLSGSVFPSESAFRSESAFFPSQSSHVTIARIIPVDPSEDSYTFTTRSSSPTYSLEYSDDPSASNPVDIPSELEEDELFMHTGRRRDIPIMEDIQTTPKQIPVVLPPTPSDSLRDWESSLGGDEVPPSPWMPHIPDGEDHELLDDWETVTAEEAEAPPALPEDQAPDTSSPPPDDGSDTISVNAPSTISPLPPPTTDDTSQAPPTSIPAPEFAHPVENSETVVPEVQPTAAPTNPTDAVPPEVPQALAEIPSLDLPPRPPLPTEEGIRTPPPSFEDLYGSEDATSPDAAIEEKRASTPPVPSPAASVRVRQALSFRKEALELNARIASLGRKRKTSLSENTAEALSAAMLAKIEIDRAEKELAELNAKAEGAFVGAYNPPTASLYEFNTTGLTPEEAVRQTEIRLGQLLLTPVPPVGTTPDDLAHDSPNRGALKVTMEQSIKGRLVKTQLLSALNENGLNWNEDPSRPNVVFVLLPVMAESSEAQPNPSETLQDTTTADRKNEGEEDDAKEY
ncbi:hypothetical protein C8F01DRAFT_1107205 [Mycena amicta]|nr:hypothetical protein C8F01DRAFT_1107205 [Mycena amicta]